jgi:hypothetical protein
VKRKHEVDAPGTTGASEVVIDVAAMGSVVWCPVVRGGAGVGISTLLASTSAIVKWSSSEWRGEQVCI